jgi:hypothetical protein
MSYTVDFKPFAFQDKSTDVCQNPTQFLNPVLETELLCIKN